MSALVGLSACAGAPDRGARTGVTPVHETGPVKIGKPYKIRGRWYHPADDHDYRETGTASWYGPKFHGKPTANGERFDQNGVSAAHRTLPLPSWVRVENLDNGREITVRVNDRGPFAHNRIIDLSRRAAQLLDMQRAGVARVRVTRVYPDGGERRVGARDIVAAAPPPTPPPTPPPLLPAKPAPETVVTAAAPTEAMVVRTVEIPGAVASARIAKAAAPAGAAKAAPAADRYRTIQVAALSDPARAAKLVAALAGIGGDLSARTETAPSGLVRVRMGPFLTGAEAETVLARLHAAGYGDARLVGTPIS
nr:septal ring lytic transglycosylase RlpA family protein [Pacificimonas pallii]